MNWKSKAQSLLNSANTTLKQATSIAKDTGSDTGVKIRTWIAELMIKSIKGISNEKDRLDVIAWLTLVRQILSNETITTKAKAQEIYAISDAKQTIQIVMRGVTTTVENYKNADLPLAVKVAIPATLAAAAIVGGQGAGIVAFGSGIGVPVLLLIFLGAAGITSVIEAFVSNSESRGYLTMVMAIIARDEAIRQTKKYLQEAMVAEQAEPRFFTMPKEEQALREKLLTMNPFDFEQHIMSFFQQQGMLSWVTKKSNDAGVDGFARHNNGLIIVQCKRYASDNVVGRPTVQQFKGVIEENDAWQGYIVTTSYFSQEAKDSALKNNKIKLIDMNALISWHNSGLTITT